MSGILRRMLAFVLGIVIGVGGALFWAYQSVKPVKIADLVGSEVDVGPELSDYTLEEFAELLIQATKNPDKYTFDRLEKEYGIDIAKLLESMGIKSEDQNQEDWNALKNISLLSILSGPDAFLDNIKLRALYVVLPAITNMPLDDILSPEAQVQLGDYTLYELLNSDEATKEMGLITALKGLKVGSLLPAVFDNTYDPDRHEYTYKVKDEYSSLQVLDLFANVPLKSLLDIVDGKDVLEELLDGGLSSIGEKPFAEIITAALGIAGDDLQDTLGQYLKALGDLSLSDLFEKDENGNYVFTPDNIAENIELGYLLGLTKGEDGKWYTDKECTEPAKGVMSVLAGIDVGDVLAAIQEGDPLEIVQSLIGNASVRSIYETIDPDGDVPAIVEALGDLNVKDLLRDGAENIVPNLIENLNYYIGDMTIGEALEDILPEEAWDVINGNKLLDALMDMTFGDFLKEEYSLDTLLDAIDNAAGEVMIGEILGYEKVDGVWQDLPNSMLGLLFDIDVGDIIDVVRSENITEAVKALFDDLTIGDVFGAVFEYGKTDADPVYHKGDAYVTEGFNNFLNVELWKVFATFDENGDYDIMNDIGQLTAGDILYSLLPAFGIEENPFTYAGGKVYIAASGEEEDFGGPFVESITKVLMNIPIKDLMDNYADLNWWAERIKEVYEDLPEQQQGVVNLAVAGICGVLYFVDKELLVEIVDNAFGEEAVFADVLGDTLGYTLNETTGMYEKDGRTNALANAFLYADMGDTLSKEPDELFEQFKKYISLGNVIDMIDPLKNLIEENTGLEFVYTDKGMSIGGDLYNLMNVVMNVTMDRIEYDEETGEWNVAIADELYELKVGDLLGFIINQISGEGTAVLNADGTWTVNTEMLPQVLTNIANISVGEIIEAIENEDYTVFRDVLKDITVRQLIDAVGVEMDWDEQKLLDKICAVQVLDVVDVILGEKTVKDLYGDITLGEILGSEKVNGEWDTDSAILALFMDITVGDVYDAVIAAMDGDLTGAAEALLGDLTIGDVFGAVFEYGKTDADPIYHKGDAHVTEGFNEFLGVELWKLVATFDENYDYDIMNDVGQLTAGDILYSLLPAFGIEENPFTYESGKVYVAGSGEEDDMFGPFVEAFTKTLLNIPIKDYAENYEDLEWWFGKLTDVYNDLPEEQQNMVNLAAVGVVGALYFIDRELLVQIVENVYGDQATFGDAVDGDFFGYTYNNETGKIEKDGYFNALAKAIMEANMCETLAKDPAEIFDQFKKYMTISNIIMLSDDLKAAIEENTGVEFVYTDKGMSIGGDLKNLMNVVMNTPFDCIKVDEDTDEVYMEVPNDLYDLLVGDLLAVVFNAIAEDGPVASYDEATGKWKVETETFEKLYTNLFNISIDEILDAIENEDYTIFRNLFEDTTVKELIDSAGVEIDWNEQKQLSKLCDVQVLDVIDLVMGEKTVKDVYGHLTVGELMGNEKVDGVWDTDNALLAVFMDITVGDIYDAMQEEEPVEAIKKLTGSITIGDVFGAMFDYVSTDSDTVWHNGDNYVTENFNDFLGLELWKLIATFIEDGGYNVMDDFVELSAGDILYSLLPAFGVEENPFTYDPATGKVYVAASGEEDDQFGPFVEAFTKTLLNIAIKDYADNYEDLEWWFDKLKEVYDELPEEQQDMVKLAAVGAVVALYFINRDLLVEIVENVYGDQATFADAVDGDFFGYKYNNETGKVEKDGYANALAKAIMEANMCDTLAKEPAEIFDQFKQYMTISNIIMLSDDLKTAIEENTDMVFVFTEEGMTIEGDLANLFNVVMNTPFDIVKTDEETGEVYVELPDEMYDLVVGDMLGFILNSMSEDGVVATYDPDTGKWTVTTETFAKLYTNLCNISIRDIVDAIENEDYTVFRELFADTTIKELIDSAGVEIDWNEQKQLEKLCEAQVLDVVDLIMGEKTVKDVYGHLTVGELMGNQKVDGVWDTDNAILALFMDITVGDIYDAMQEEDPVEALKKLTGSITIGDVFGAAFDYVSTDSNAVWHKGDVYVTEGFNDFLDLELWKLIATFVEDGGYNILDDVVELTAGDILYSLYPVFSEEENPFTYDPATGKVYVAASGEEDDQFGTFVEAFTKTLLNIAVKDYADNYEDLEWWFERLKDVYHELPEEQQDMVKLAAVGVVGALYFIDRDLLVQIVEDVFGDQATFADALHNNFFGYTFDEATGAYTKDGYTNVLVRAIMEANMCDTLAKDPDQIFDQFKPYMTISNIIMMSDMLKDYIEENSDFTLVYTDKGMSVEGDLYNFMNVMMNTPFDIVSVDEDTGEVTFEVTDDMYNLLVGDLLGYVLNSMSEDGVVATYDPNTGKWTVDTETFATLYTNLSNMSVGTLLEAMNDGDLTVLRELFENMTIRELVDSAGAEVDWDNEPFMRNLCAPQVLDAVDLIMGRLLFKDVYGTVKISDLMYEEDLAAYDGNKFMQATLDVTIGIICDLFDINISDDEKRDLVFDVYGELYFNDLYESFCLMGDLDPAETLDALPAGKAAVEKILNKYQVKLFQEKGLKEGIKTILDDVLLGDFVAELVKDVLESNEMKHDYEYTDKYYVTNDSAFKAVTEAFYNVSMLDFVNMMRDPDEFNEFIGDFKLGDFMADVLVNVVPEDLFDYGINYEGGVYSADENGTFVAITNRLLNKTIAELQEFEDEDKLNEFIGKFKLGDFMADVVNLLAANVDGFDLLAKYNAATDDYTVDGNLGKVFKKAYNITVEQLMDEDFDIIEYFKDLRVGDFVAQFIADAAADNDDFTHTFENAANGDYIVTGEFNKVFEKVYNLTIAQLMDENFDMVEYFGTLKIGDFTKDIVNPVAEGIDELDYKVDYDGTDYTVTGLFERVSESIYNLTINEAREMMEDRSKIKAYFGELYVGDFLVDIAVNVADRVEFFTHDVTFDNGYKVGKDGQFAHLAEVIYNLKLADAYDMIGDRSKLMAYFGDELKIGDFTMDIANAVSARIDALDYEVSYDANGNFIVNGYFEVVSETVYNVTLRELYNMLRDRSLILDKFGDLRLGDFMYDVVNKVVEKVNRFTFNVSVNAAGDYEVEPDNIFEALGNEFYNLKLRKLYSMARNFDELKEYVYGFKVGDFTADIGEKIISRVFSEHTMTYANGNYTVGGPGGIVVERIYNTTLGKLRSYASNPKSAIEMFDMPIGYYLAEIMPRIAARMPSLYEGNVEETPAGSGTYTATGNYAVVLNKVVNIYVKEFLTNFRDRTTDYLMDLFGEIMAGELLGGYYVEATDTWYSADDDHEIDFGEGIQALIMKKAFKIKVNEIQDFDFMTLMDGVTINDVLLTQMTQQEIDDNALLKAMKDIEVMNFAMDTVYDVTVGELMGYHKDAGVWYDSNDNALDDALMECLVDYKVGELMGADGYELYDTNGDPVTFSEDVIAKIGANMTLGDVLGDSVNDNTVFTALKDTKIEDLGTEVNDLTIGELMGYHEVGGTWYDSTNAALDDSLMECLVDYKIGELTGIDGYELYGGDPVHEISFSEHVMNKLTNTLTLKDVLGEDTVNNNSVLKSLGDKKIGNLADEIDNMYIGEIMGFTHTEMGKYIEVKPNAATWAASTWYAEYGDGSNGTWYYQDLNHNLVAVTSQAQLDNVGAKAIYKLSTNDEGVMLYNQWMDGANAVDNNLTLIIADLKISQINDDFGETILKDIKNNLTLKDVLGAETVENNTVLNALKDIKIGKLADGIDDLTVGELMGYEYNDLDGKWYKGGVALTDPLMKVLVGYTVADMTDADFADDLMADIQNNLTLEDVLGPSVNNNNVLASLADTKICDLTKKINSMYFGDLMGYTHEARDGYYTEVKPAPANSTWTAATNWQAEYTDGTWYYQDIDHVLHVVTGKAQLDAAHAKAIYKAGATESTGVKLYEEWKDGGATVTDNLTRILADIKISDVGGDFADTVLDDIKYNLTLRDVMGNAVDTNKLLSLIADDTIDEIDTKISDVYIGQIMAPAGKTYVVKTIVFTNKTNYHIDTAVPGNNVNKVLFETTDEAHATLKIEDDTTKYHEGDTYFKYVDSELSQVMGCYQISEVNDDDFTDRMVNDILNKVTVGTIYPDAGTGTGFMSLLDPDWKLADMTTNLNTTLTTASVGTFMNLGIVDLTNENKAMLDDLYVSDYASTWNPATTPDVRGYWTGKTMSALISSMIDNISPYATNYAAYSNYAANYTGEDLAFTSTVYAYYTYKYDKADPTYATYTSSITNYLMAYSAHLTTQNYDAWITAQPA